MAFCLLAGSNDSRHIVVKRFSAFRVFKLVKFVEPFPLQVSERSENHFPLTLPLDADLGDDTSVSRTRRLF